MIINFIYSSKKRMVIAIMIHIANQQVIMTLSIIVVAGPLYS